MIIKGLLLENPNPWNGDQLLSVALTAFDPLDANLYFPFFKDKTSMDGCRITAKIGKGRTITCKQASLSIRLLEGGFAGSGLLRAYEDGGDAYLEMMTGTEPFCMTGWTVDDLRSDINHLSGYLPKTCANARQVALHRNVSFVVKSL